MEVEKQNKRFAILRNDHLGDLILTSGLARNLSKAGYGVDIYCRPAWADTFKNNPHANSYGAEFGSPSADGRNARALLKRGHYQHILVPYRDRELLRLSFLSGIPHRWAQMGGWLARLTFHHCLRADTIRHPRHMADVWLDVARALHLPVDDGHPELFLTETEIADIQAKIEAHFKADQLVVLHPFHGKSSCNWPLENYVGLARQLAGIGCQVVITGNATERPLLEPFYQGMKDAGIWVSAGELNLREFFALIGSARLLICSSTGALHVSSALNVPSLSLFCPHPLVNATLWHSFAADSKVLTPPEEACPRFRSPESCHHCQFSGALTIEDVLRQSLKLLETRLSAPGRAAFSLPPTPH